MNHRFAPSRLTTLSMATALALLSACSHQPRPEASAAPVEAPAPVLPAPPPVATAERKADFASAPQGENAAPRVQPQVRAAAPRRKYAATAPTAAMVDDLLAGESYVAAAAPAPQAAYQRNAYTMVAAPNNKFPDQDSNRLKLVAEHPLSTFSVDVDTASYAYVRRMLSGGSLPPAAAVRVEEMVNYFPYQYPTPASRAQPFGVTTAVMPNPWKADTQLVHIGVRGFDIATAARPRANVVLLIDVSGSMEGPDRLALLKKSFRMMVSKLQADDRVAIVVYAGGADVLLQPTLGASKEKILDAIDTLRPGGSTAGAEGLQRAYALAERHFDKGGVNRVILATDGDFNVGINDPKELEKFVAAKRKTGVYLSILGVGEGNLNDAMMQRLAQAGNGNAAYIDTLMEARKALSEELGSTMFPIANDVKVQVEFNPAQVGAYRLVGYETRMLEKQDFNDDKVDAGDMGAGHTVTAIYEITRAADASRLVDPLRYQAGKAGKPAVEHAQDELCLVKVRYKLPGQPDSKLTQHVVKASAVYPSLAAVPDDQRFAVAVAAFGQRLRGEKEVGEFSYADIASLANGARGKDTEGYRAEFVKLVRMAHTMSDVNGRGQP